MAREAKSKGFLRSITTMGAVSRALPYWRMNRELFSLPLFRRYLDDADDINPLFHLRHRYYLCAGWGMGQRISAALSHYRFEDTYHDEAYKDAVYRDGGLVLWSCRRDETDYQLLLRGPTKDRHEGGTSIVLTAGTAWLAEMSYAWVDAALLQSGLGCKVIFITRNQSSSPDAAELKLFRKHFPQHSPPYFCLAAMQGIAMVHRQSTVAGIRHDRQIAYLPQYERSFTRSYSEFWQSFGGVQVSQLAYFMPLPLMVRPLDHVASKHRNRAAERRTQWSAITESAMTSINGHVGLPIDVAAQTSILRASRTGSEVPLVS
jgi:uncharacterized protein VirK/YbjX